MISRRGFHSALLSAASLGALGPRLGAAAFSAPSINSTIGGVRIGAITYSFRAEPALSGEDYLAVGLRGCASCGLGYAELWATMVQPPTILHPAGQYDFNPDTPQMRQARQQLRDWRLSTPKSYWQGIRRRFDNAGINLFGYSLTLADDFTDEELVKTFEALHAMRINILGTNQTRLAMARRIVPLVDKHKVTLAFHNHSHVDQPNEIASIDSMRSVMEMSKHYWINLDIGHFVAGNQDPIAFIRQYHSRITHLHLKDRKRNDGPNMPWGQGDTPITEVLQLIKRERYPIPCLIEYEYKGERSPIEEVRECVAYIRRALA